MNDAFVLEALLRHNYLPLQKKDRAEMPPFLSTVSLTPTVANGLVSVNRRSPGIGWDATAYQATRFNGVARVLTIPHPLAYAYLCRCIYDNWTNLAYSAASKHSLVRPRQHPDGRIVIMDYEKPRKACLALAFGKRFQVKTDIANFFPSIYSHAITWAAVGFSHAKANKDGNWFNDLDKKVRWTKRNETQGVPIGPATSNIVAELILARIDDELEARGFQFIRYIDDYTAYCETEDKAQDFILALADQLADYKLSLNIKKTHITQLPIPEAEKWVADLALGLPTGEVDKYLASNYLNQATAMASQTPDGSVLKYAIKTLLGRKLKSGVEAEILPQILNLSFHHPLLIPFLSGLFHKTIGLGGFKHGGDLHQLALTNARFRRSDGLCWSLFYLNRHSVPIDDSLASAVLSTKDCLALLLLYLSGNTKHQDAVVDFANQHVSAAADHYELDQYWVLLYELFRTNKIATPYSDEGAFEYLKNHGVSFVVANAFTQTAPAASAGASAAAVGAP